MAKYVGIFPVVRKEGMLSATEYPVVSFLPGLDVLYVKEQHDTYGYVRDQDLPVDTVGIELYQAALQNLSEKIDYSIVHTPYGGFAIFGDDEFEASSLLYKQIWTLSAEKLEDDLLIAVPASNTVLFIPRGAKQKVPELLDHAKGVYDISSQKISLQLYVFEREKEVLKVYEEEH